MADEDQCVGVVAAEDLVEGEVVVAEEVTDVEEEGEVQPSPLVVEERRKGEQYGDDEVKDREDAKAAACVEAAEVSGVVAGVVEDTGDEKTGEDEEEVDAHPSVLPDVVECAENGTAMGASTEVVEEDHGDGEGADAIECRETRFEVDGLKLPGGYRHEV